jgi:hypothetical protein
VDQAGQLAEELVGLRMVQPVILGAAILVVVNKQR